MPTTSQTLAFAVTATILVVIPGPSVLFTIGRALTIGRRGALLTVLGNALGMFVQVVAVAFGLAALIETSAHVYTAVKLLGAAYLVFLGVQAIRHRRALVATDVQAPVIRTRRVLREGFIVGLTNPKMIVFFAAALPQFIDRDAGHVPAADGGAGLDRAGRRDGLRQRLGAGRRDRAHLVRRVRAPDRADEHRRWGRDDRRRNHPGPVRRPRGALIAESPAVGWMG